MSSASLGAGANTDAGSMKSSLRRLPPITASRDHGVRAGEVLEQHDRARVDIGGGRHLAAALLWCHVRERADRLGTLGRASTSPLAFGQVRDAEVAEHHLDAREGRRRDGT